MPSLTPSHALSHSLPCPLSLPPSHHHALSHYHPPTLSHYHPSHTTPSHYHQSHTDLTTALRTPRASARDRHVTTVPFLTGTYHTSRPRPPCSEGDSSARCASTGERVASSWGDTTRAMPVWEIASGDRYLRQPCARPPVSASGSSKSHVSTAHRVANAMAATSGAVCGM
eukprot:2842177-Rhodomonas_salina.3